MNNICSTDYCTGCYACINSCPVNAIKIIQDKLGFIYPKIDKTKCINCGICQKKCPQLNKLDKKYPKTVYAAYSKNKKTREESTSGGIAAMLYEYVLSENGVAYGVSSKIEDNQIKFERISEFDSLKKFKGSKYVQAYINDIFKLVKKDLHNNKLVLFVGTPCQVAGLKLFLNKDYENLYTVDIVCHGVSSQKLLFEELKLNNVNEFDNISFRDRDGYFLKCYKNEIKILDLEMNQSYYYKNFFNGNICRKSCYNCQYATIERCSDITIGDFWGLSEESKIKDDEKKGISLVMPISEKGNRLFSKIKAKLILEEREVKEAQNGNTQLKTPLDKIKKRNIFEKIYIKHGYVVAMKKIRTIKEYLKDNKKIYKIYKKIRGNIK